MNIPNKVLIKIGLYKRLEESKNKLPSEVYGQVEKLIEDSEYDLAEKELRGFNILVPGNVHSLIKFEYKKEK